MSENPEEPDFEFDELEKELKKLNPSPLKVDFLSELERDCTRTMSQGFSKELPKTHWKRLIPILAAACVMLAGYVYVNFRDHSPQETSTDSLVAGVDEEVPVQMTSGENRFEPVSSQGYLIKASSGGIIPSDEGPLEEMNLEYRDAYHWRDPSTGTNLRIFTPRQEKIIIPAETH